MASIKYQENGEIKDLTLKIGDTLPTGTEVDYNGDTVPTGWEEIGDTVQATIGTTNPNNDRVWFKQGKNLCNNNVLNLALNYQNNTIISDANSKTVYAAVPKNTDITISKTSVTNRFRVGLLNSIPQNNDSVNIVFMDDDSSTLNTTINTSTYTIVAIQYTNSNQTTNIQVEIGETATAYEPYIRKAININGKDEYYTNDYSTTEQVIGKWIDGKPLYRIVYKSTTYNTAYEIPIANINEIVSVKALVQRGDYSTIYLPVPSRSNVAEWKSDFGNVVNINNIKAQVNFTFGTNVETNFGSITIILEYTKTTD